MYSNRIIVRRRRCRTRRLTISKKTYEYEYSKMNFYVVAVVISFSRTCARLFVLLFGSASSLEKTIFWDTITIHNPFPDTLAFDALQNRTRGILLGTAVRLPRNRDHGASSGYTCCNAPCQACHTCHKGCSGPKFGRR